MADNKTEKLEVLEGTVVKILFSNPETFYTVAVVTPPGHTKGAAPEYVVVGNLSGVHPQERLSMTGSWIHDKRYGRQFKIRDFTATIPGDAVAIEKYLSSGLIKGIGKSNAARMVETFGVDLFDIIENEPEKLNEIPGIGPKRIASIVSGWNEHRAIRDIVLFLQQFGISQSFAPRIFKQYGDKAIEQLKKNPYQLALDVRGIGFKSADDIAQKIGIPLHSVDRCKAGVYFMLQEMAGSGHTFFPADPLITKATEMLAVETPLIVTAINALKESNHVVLEILPDGTKAVYLNYLYKHESGVAEHMNRLLCTGKLFPKINAEKSLEEFEAESKFKLAENQKLAVRDALRGGVLVITGGPGTGKTTIIRTILKILDRHGISSLLAAPTGRAAKRMQELTHKPASTIHRLLQYSPGEGGYQRNPKNPLKADFLIVDESSMIDIALAHALVKATASTSSVIFVGDIDQLPSVGPGNFLQDLITSGAIPVVRLNEVFRQAQTSKIVTNAHKINQGLVPSFGGNENDENQKKDFYFFDGDTPEKCLEIIRDLVHHRIPAKFGFDPKNEVQILAPMHRGVIGAQNLNREVQNVLNPAAASFDRGGVSFRVGDKVMQLSNDYDKDVFNGDIGLIMSIDREDQLVKVMYDGKLVAYEFNEMDSVDLAYCITVHKSQGSEYKAVIIPVHSTHFVMLQRTLLYTAITRGKKLVCLVGQKRAVQMAVNNISAEPRFSGLNLRIKQIRDASHNPQDF